MQKQSFQRFPIRYRPYDFPSRFPVLAFLGDNWTISVNSPEYLHFHNGLEIGHCISGNGQLFLAGQAPVPYEAEAFSILFPQVPHLAVRGLQESRWEYIYIDPKHFLESASDCGSDIWQIFYMLQEVPVIVTAASFPLLYHYLSRISGNSRKKNRFISRLSMGCCFPFFQKSTALPCRLQTRSCRNPGTAILISAVRSVICMHIIMSRFLSAALQSTAASAKAIYAGCLKIWWGSVLWSICSITVSSRPAT